MNNFQKMITNRYLYIPLILWFCIQTFKVIYELIKTKKSNDLSIQSWILWVTSNLTLKEL